MVDEWLTEKAFDDPHKTLADYWRRVTPGKNRSSKAARKATRTAEEAMGPVTRSRKQRKRR
jgi:hypothetical protein